MLVCRKVIEDYSQFVSFGTRQTSSDVLIKCFTIELGYYIRDRTGIYEIDNATLLRQRCNSHYIEPMILGL